MKLLIVDDEEHVREGIELSIDWGSHNIDQIFMAENGLEALELVRAHQPEIIICDMSMHIMDGPQFLEELREEGWTSKVIVLSGYQQFDYARATLLASGVDYLLKPFKINDLNEAIEKACSQVNEERRKQLTDLSTTFRINEVNHLVKEQRFASLIENETTSVEELAAFLTSLGINQNNFFVVTYLPRNKDELVKQYYAGDEQLFNFALKNITKEFFDAFGKWYFIQYEEFIVLMFSSNMAPYNVQSKINQLRDAWERTLQLSTFVGFQNQCITIDKLQSTLLEEKSMILSSNIINNSKQDDNNHSLYTFMDKELVILEAVRTKNMQHIKEMIRTFSVELMTKQYVSLRELQHYTVEINLLLIRIYSQLKDGRLHETMPLWISCLEEWTAKLEQIFSDMMGLIDYSKFELNHTQHILAVRNYINDHLKEDITLASLAERFHFSAQYLAKRFKEEYNTTIIHYLTQQRMDKASSLLIHTDLSIQDIAAESGFEELNYFSKVFRKHFNFSPTSYRKKFKQ